jgi:hypothetical protein
VGRSWSGRTSATSSPPLTTEAECLRLISQFSSLSSSLAGAVTVPRALRPGVPARLRRCAMNAFKLCMLANDQVRPLLQELRRHLHGQARHPAAARLVCSPKSVCCKRYLRLDDVICEPNSMENHAAESQFYSLMQSIDVLLFLRDHWCFSLLC